MSLKLYNTLTNKKEIFEPIEQGKVGMYVCGVTVYDNCHLGHARAYVAFDILVRYFRYQGYKVNYVRNITDIEDKIIERANENSESIYDLTSRTIASMHADFQGLGLIEPNSEPKATEYIDGMVTMIEDLIAKGHAYVADNNDVFFSVRSYEEYGKLSNKVLDDLDPGSRISEDQAKADPLDFVLWKSAKPEEPSWDSPWGKGRPGWHIECSVMSLEKLGKNFDIHGGGPDLIFPHHENESAQTCGAYGVHNDPQFFAKYWIHNGFLDFDGEKMSKSLGNILYVHDLIEKYQGEVLRLTLLSTHYRQPLNWNSSVIKQSKNILDRIYRILNKSKVSVNSNVEPSSKIVDALCDDLNTSIAIAEINRLANQLSKATTEKDEITIKSTLLSSAKLLGILTQNPEDWLGYSRQDESIDHKKIDELVIKRNEARSNKDFELADKIRDQLNKMNIEIEDTPDGTVWKINK